ncbi:MAG: dethiobiotin synthetase [Halieaceae bacterium]|jgi:dethiobiotin synthetase
MSSGKALFIAGTDTGVGKTLLGEAILLAANKAGLSTAAVKPIAAGCDADGTNEDARALMRAMSFDLPYQQVNPVALREAIAPHIAAAHEGRTLRVSQLAGYCRGVLMKRADLTVIEGAGGWRVPLNAVETLADLVRELQLGVVLVVGMRLGCINHALLTAEAIRADGLELKGWVANQIDPDMPCYEENLATLKQRIAAPLLADVPWSDTLVVSQVADLIDISVLL